MASESLGLAIRNRFEVNRVSWQDAARRLEMSPNSLRAWTNRNQFPQWAVLKIAEFAGLPADLEKLQEQYDFELTRVKRSSRESLDVLLESSSADLTDAFNMLDGRFEKLAAGGADLGGDLKLLFRCLGEGDTRVYWSIDREPWEFTHEGVRSLGPEMVRAAKDGARFLYLYPSADVAAVARRADFRRPLGGQEFKDIHSRFERFLESAMKGAKGASLKSKMERFSAVECDIPGYMLPGFAMSLYSSQGGSASAPVYRAFAVVPTGTPERDAPLHMPLDRTATDRFVGFVKASLLEAKEVELAHEI